VSLPGTSGIDAIRPMREKFPQMKIIMHSNYDHEDKILRARQAGASGYMLKNQGVAALRGAILKVGGGGSVWPSGYEEFSAAARRAQRPGLLSAIVQKCREFF
jgi:DNA-binding NarL/FixJ family response regulator